MATEHTMLSFIMRRYVSAREDAATDALGWILNRSSEARAGFMGFLREIVPEVPEVTSANSRVVSADRGVPDLACRDHCGNVVAFVESKFWAPLTRHQPVSYWNQLPTDAASVLLVIAPKPRVCDSDHLWDELIARLRSCGYVMENARSGAGIRAASHISSSRTLILSSWDVVLDRLQEAPQKCTDNRTLFEIGELRGVASAEYDASDTSRDDVLRELIRDVVNQAEREGWVDINGLSWGGWREFPGRFLCLSGAYAFLGLNYRGLDDTGRLMWLVFNEYGSEPGQVTTAEVYERLGDLGLRGNVRGHDMDYSVLLETPTRDLDSMAQVQFVVEQLRSIAGKVNPEAFTND